MNGNLVFRPVLPVFPVEILLLSSSPQPDEHHFPTRCARCAG
jgi:hypothetical protein